jgi:carotenoid 1,2-hydratase
VLASRPGFEAPSGLNSYAWWYLDALSDDGAHGLTLIGFIGSVFSPYYAWARRRARAQGLQGVAPEQHCAMNVALYALGPSVSTPGHWAMTERGASALQVDAERLRIGPSQWRWQDGELLIDLDERCAPWPARIAGQVRVRPGALAQCGFALDRHGRHRWQPIAPMARIEVQLDHPRLRWQGEAYLDHNNGDRPLEDDFRAWSWSRGLLQGDAAGSRCAIVYDVERLDGSRLALGLACDKTGRLQAFRPPGPATLPRGRWGVSRPTRSEVAQDTVLRHALEDGPFYTRSVVDSHLCGQPVRAVHESLSLERFRQPWVQALLPFRMPRRGAG